MAREVMIVDSSASMRRIFRAMILANVDDTEVTESQNVNDAMEKLKRQRFHAVLFSRESSNEEWLNFIKRTGDGSEKTKTVFVLFTSNKQSGFIEEAKSYGVADHLIIPCADHALADIMTKVYNPFDMRASRRYNIPDTVAILEQGGESFQAEVINFSEGGMLCGMDFSEKYAWPAPVMATLNFSIGGKKETVKDLYSISARLVVTESNPDFTPKRLRVAFRFEIVPEESRNILEKVFAHVEQQEQQVAGG